MKKNELTDTVNAMFAGDKGLLAMDESTSTINKRFKEAGIPQTVEYHQAYRDLIVNTPGLGKCISGAILFDETIHQTTKAGVPFAEALKKIGIVPGIKVDEGTIDLAHFPGEKITAGLDGLDERLSGYYKLGARFAKWRAVITIGKGIPTNGCIEANTHALARYAAMCQEADIVPIVEPEVLMDGDHDIDRCFEATEKVQRSLFNQLILLNVDLEHVVLKPNMILPGTDSKKKASIEEVADATVHCLLRTVPAAVPGVAFLSGGQSPEEATAHLNAMHVRFKGKLPWALTFSFARAIQQPAMDAWGGKDENVAVAQKLLYERAKLDNAARRGEYKPEMEK